MHLMVKKTRTLRYILAFSQIHPIGKKLGAYNALHISLREHSGYLFLRLLRKYVYILGNKYTVNISL